MEDAGAVEALSATSSYLLVRYGDLCTYPVAAGSILGPLPHAG